MGERIRHQRSLGDRVTPGRVPGTTPSAMDRLASAGNRAVTRLLRSAGADLDATPPGLAAAVRAAASGGVPLPGGVRDGLEAGLGAALGAVRVHTGTDSAALSDRVGAHAFTVGQDIHFARGAYDPAGERGYHLLAHEVVHTLAPGTGAPARSLTIGPSDSPAEREAEAIATRLTARRHDPGAAVEAPAGGGAPGIVQRFGRAEHQQIGDATHADVDLGNGLILSWGDVVSLAGDEFGSVQELQAAAATPAGRAGLRRIMSSDGNHSAQYVDLAMHNVPHFAGGGTAMATWSSHHESALLTALLSGLNDSEQEWQQAQLVEAFGQHFLTDSFSAGHVRTPRAAIIAWYQDDFAPRALPPLIAYAKNWLRTELIRQIGPQVVMPDAALGAQVDALMWGALKWFDDDIHQKLQPLIGLGISGAISGVLHDRDNERGLWVASAAHPDPWLAYGDGRLRCSPVSADQAELAVITAREELVRARALGAVRRAERGVVAQTSRPVHEVPSAVHFGLDSDVLDGPTITALNEAADFLTAHSEQVVDISGHTCPLGTDAYNDRLGLRRAEAVATYLMTRGIAPDRLHTATAGERQLLSAERPGYPSDRRAELAYRAVGDAPTDMEWAGRILAERLPGPPYAEVERFVPYEIEVLNDPQEDWHWGTMSSEMAAEINRWIASYAGSAVAAVASDPRLDDQRVPVLDVFETVIVKIQPRKPVQDLLGQLIADGTGLLGRMVGMPAANRSVPPLPPPVPCPGP